MSRMVKFLSIAVVLFSLAASASWYLQYRQGQETELKAPDEKGAKASGATNAKGGTDTPGTRPLIRPPVSADADRMTRAASTIQQQQESLKAREQQLVVREKQMDLIHVEIKKEQKKLDGVRKEIQVELQLVQEKLESLEKKTAEADKTRILITRESNDLDSKKTEINGIEASNVKKLATIYDKMDPEAAAQGIEQMIEKGKLDMAVTIISGMGQRQAAGLLSEVSKQDPGMAVQIFDRMRYHKISPTTPK